MAKQGKCINTDCEHYKEVFDIPAGEEFVCPHCHQTLGEASKGKTKKIGEKNVIKRTSLIAGCVMLLFALMYGAYTLFSANNEDRTRVPIPPIKTDTVVIIQRDTIIKVQYSSEAEQRYRADAERGDAAAQFALGCNYYAGEKGLPQSYSEAVKWYRKAAAQGYAPAQNNLGYCYECGYGVSKNLDEAKKLYEKAAAQGDNTAKRNLERIEIQDRMVDLGLPSGLKWAKTNIGAASENDIGKIMKYDIFIQEMTKKEWNSSVWRLPKIEDFKELFSCKWDWTEETSNNGARITGFNITGHNGNKMFLPFPKVRFSARNTIINHYLLESDTKETNWINLQYDSIKDKLDYMYILENSGNGFVRMVKN